MSSEIIGYVVVGILAMIVVAGFIMRRIRSRKRETPWGDD